MGIYILLAVISCIVSITYYKKYLWHKYDKETHVSAILLSFTLMGVFFPFGWFLLFVIVIIFSLFKLCEKVVEWLDSV